MTTIPQTVPRIYSSLLYKSKTKYLQSGADPSSLSPLHYLSHSLSILPTLESNRALSSKIRFSSSMQCALMIEVTIPQLVLVLAPGAAQPECLTLGRGGRLQMPSWHIFVLPLSSPPRHPRHGRQLIIPRVWLALSPFSPCVSFMPPTQPRARMARVTA